MEINEELGKQVHFLQELEKLKGVQRANRTLDGRNENSAEHSWHVALMALVLKSYAPKGVNLQRVNEMLLIHDLVEIDAGDTWLFAENQDHKVRDETAAARRLFGLLPESQGKAYIALWQEFEARRTPDARFAAAVDSIQPLLNHLITGNPADGVIPAAKVLAKKAFIEEAAPDLWVLVKDLIQKSEARGLYLADLIEE